MNIKYEYVGFDVVKEDWTEFQLPDDTILRIKFILTSVLKPKGTMGDFSVKSENIATSIVPEQLWGEPETRKYSPQELGAYIEEQFDEGIKCKTPDQWNVYRIKDKSEATFSVKLELLNAARTTRHDSRGERNYIYNVQPIMKTKVPIEVHKRLATMRSEKS